MLLFEQVMASFVVNILGVCCVLLLKTAPPRLTLTVCLASMAPIFMPWFLLGDALMSLFQQGTLEGIAALSGLEAPSLVAALPEKTAVSASTTFANIVLFEIVVGLLFAAWTLWQSMRTTNRWRNTATQDDALASHAHPELMDVLAQVTVHRLPNTSRVATTGLWRTEVWIGDRLQSPAQITTALNHELCHVASRDQWVLFAIVMLERVLWWNPLIWFLGRHARRSMEYACDARCKRLVGPQEYGRSLAEILLLEAPVTAALEISLGNQSDIVHRMENLKMKTKFAGKHFLILGCASLALAGVSAVAATDSGEVLKPTLIECHKLVPEGVQYDFRITSNIDTREGRTGEMNVTLVDPSAEQTGEIPSGAEQFLACVQGVVGVGDGEGWPGG